MGRITIFSSDQCLHSERVKNAMDMLDIPYVEISVTKYPHRRNDMMHLSGGNLSTPQVFFNTRYVGGADPTIELLQSWEQQAKEASSQATTTTSGKRAKTKQPAMMTPRDRYNTEIAQLGNPANPRLALPDPVKTTKQQPHHDDDDTTTRTEISSAFSIISSQHNAPEQGNDNDRGVVVAGAPKKHVVEFPDGRSVSVLKTTEMLKKLLPIGDHACKGTRYKKSFTNEDAVACFVDKFGLDDEADAVAFGRRLQDVHSLLHHVNDNDKKYPFGTPGALFRLHCHHQPSVLNSYMPWTEPVSHDAALSIVSRLDDMLDHIEMQVTDDRGKIDYKKAARHDQFPDLEQAMCQVQKVDLAAMDETTKMAFGVNIYNLMIKYAFMKVGFAVTDLSRMSFFSDVKFCVGGYDYSLSEWEHGILRGNRKPPGSLSGSPAFGRKDPRAALCIREPDARVHFGLNCGAKSCPPVRYYTPENLNAEMSMVAMSFCEDSDNVSVDVVGREVKLSKIFKWYKSDYADSDRGLLQVVCSYLYPGGVKRQLLRRMLDNDNKPIKVTYTHYDWTTNAKEKCPFQASKLKANKMAVGNLFAITSSSKKSSSSSTTAATVVTGSSTTTTSRRSSASSSLMMQAATTQQRSLQRSVTA